MHVLCHKQLMEGVEFTTVGVIIVSNLQNFKKFGKSFVHKNFNKRD